MAAQLLCCPNKNESDATIATLRSGRGIIATEDASISRKDVNFFTVDRDRVAIEIKVTNLSDRVLAPSRAQMLAAPFGAFVPWQPLVTLPIPALPPRRVQYLRASAIPMRLEPLGSPDRVPPRKLLTALGLPDNFAGKPSRQQETAARQPGSPALPADLMKVLLQETPHWVGNINVLVGNNDVERHLARALRVYPGRVNLAWFFVGSSGRDSYAFRLKGLSEEWEARLFDMTARESLVLDVNENPAMLNDQWVEVGGTRVILLGLQPPKNCPSGTIEVHVTQKSTGRTAVVEFSLDPKAAGRGCYVV